MGGGPEHRGLLPLVLQVQSVHLEGVLVQVQVEHKQQVRVELGRTGLYRGESRNDTDEPRGYRRRARGC